MRVAEVLYDQFISTEGRNTSANFRDGSSRRRAVSEDTTDGNGNEQLPCRIQAKTFGVEVFFYNRSPAYDLILDGLLKSERDKKTGSVEADARQNLDSAINNEARDCSCPHEKSVVEQPANRLPLPRWLASLPVSLACKKGAIVVGNANTRSLVIAKFDYAKGIVDACTSGPLDVYRQTFDLAFTCVNITLNENPGFKEPQVTTALSAKRDVDGDIHGREKSARNDDLTGNRRFKLLQSVLSAHGKLSGAAAQSKGSAKQQVGSSADPEENDQNGWQGLMRYQNAVESDHQADWDAVDYAKMPNVAELPSLKVSIYWDIPGIVPYMQDSLAEKAQSSSNHINNATPPEYGVELHVNGGVINYGPWADRQRVNLQQIFFPQIYKDAAPASALVAGQERVYTSFKIYVEIHEAITLRIPTREASKDWKWKVNARPFSYKKNNEMSDSRAHLRNRKKSIWHRLRRKNAASPEIRPMGWLDTKIDADSTVAYDMAMVSGEGGYSNSLTIDCRSIEISSSVNHGLLWRSGRVQMNCDLSNPCRWNALRIWTFDISCDELEFFVLRDHAFLLADLVTDWATGPAPDFYTFVPFQYVLKLNLQACKVYLNANDGNIINNPSDMDDNTFLLLQLPRLCIEVGIPLTKLNPIKNKVTFDATGDDAELHLWAGARSTLRTFMNSTFLAKAAHFDLKGDYCFFNESSTHLTDTLTLDVQSVGVALCLYGFLIHYFIQFKENYFGDYIHFKTMDEFQGLPRSLNPGYLTATEQEKSPSNDLDVMLIVSVSTSKLFLPTNLYVATSCLELQIPYFHLDLRVTNYYMDMTANSGPITINLAETLDLDSPDPTMGSAQLFIDFVTISGHRLFGLPPSEPTYVCLWDFIVGDLTGECSFTFGERLLKFINTFPFVLDNAENALSLEPLAAITDMTFLRMKSGILNVLMHVENFAIRFTSDPFTLDFNDYATGFISRRLKLVMSDITFYVFEKPLSNTAEDGSGESCKMKVVTFLSTALCLDLLMTEEDTKTKLDAQQHHLRKHDSRTNRCSFLFVDQINEIAAGVRASLPTVSFPAMIFPPLPIPLLDGLDDPLVNSGNSSNSSDSSFSSLGPSTSSYVRANVQPYCQKNPRARPMSGIRASIFESRTSSREDRINSTTRNSCHSDGPCSDPANYTNDGCVGEGVPVPYASGLSTLKQSVFSSPKFPLLTATVDLKDVPHAKKFIEDFPQMKGSELSEESSFADIGNSSPGVSLLIDMRPGVRAYCTQDGIMALSSIFPLFSSLQAVDLTDDLQVKVMEVVMRTQSRTPIASSNFSLGLNVASIDARFDVMPDHATNGTFSAGSDRYNMQSQETKIMFRKRSEEISSRPETYSGHVTSRGLSASLLYRLDESDVGDLVANAVAKSSTVWFSNLRHKELGINLDGLETRVHSQKLIGLRGTIGRIEGLNKQAECLFDKLGDREQLRMYRLIHLLTSAGENISDPPFLSRPSYTARGYAENFRNNNSWRIISRFRYILQNLPVDPGIELMKGNDYEAENRQANLKGYVLSKLRSWQICDPEENLSDSCFIRLLFDQATSLHEERFKEGRLTSSLRLLSTRLVIDPGPEQSIMTTDDLSAYFETHSAPHENIVAPVTGLNLHRAVTLELYLGNFFMDLDWRLPRNLTDITVLFEGNAANARPTSQSAMTNVGSSTSSFQVVIVVEGGSIQVNSAHLAHVFESTGLSFSLERNPETDVKLLLHADILSSCLYSTSKPIWFASLTSSNMSLSRMILRNRKSEASWQIGGSINRAHAMLKEEIHNLIEIADKFVLEEATQLKQWYEKTNAPRSDKTYFTIADQNKKPCLSLSLSLLMDSYQVQCIPIYSLMFVMKGRSLRIASNIKTGEQSFMSFNYDLKKQNYSMVNQEQEQLSTIANIKIPPIGGQFTMQNQQHQSKIKVFTVLEEISIDARSIYAILNLVGLPEVESAYNAIKYDFGILETNVRALSKHEDSVERRRTPDRATVFNIYFTSGGIRVGVEAPAQRGHTWSSSFAFNVQSIQLKTANLDNRRGPMSKVPDILIVVRKVDIRVGKVLEGRQNDCGSINFDVLASCKNRSTSLNKNVQDFQIRCSSFRVDFFTETAETSLSIADHVQAKFKHVDLSKERKYLRRLRHAQHSSGIFSSSSAEDDKQAVGFPLSLLSGTLSFDVHSIRISWIANETASTSANTHLHYLIFSIEKLAFRAKEDYMGKLSIEEIELQLRPAKMTEGIHSANHARLPQVVFNVALLLSSEQWSLRFRASGQPLNAHLLSDFLYPANIIKSSMEKAIGDLKSSSLSRRQLSKVSKTPRDVSLGRKRLGMLTVDANFAGAKVQLHMNKTANGAQPKLRSGFGSQLRYEKLSDDGTKPRAVLWTPGIAIKLQYANDVLSPKLYASICIQASTNSLAPTFVPIVLHMLDSIKRNVREDKKIIARSSLLPAKDIAQTSGIEGSASAIEKTKLHLGFRVCRQEFSLTCRPIAKVDATASFDEVYLTLDDIHSAEEDKYYSLTGKVENLRIAIQHVYSQESTFNLRINSILLSIIKTKALQQQGGISAIVEISHVDTQLNAKQLQDFLLFRDIWIPDKVRGAEQRALPSASNNPHEYFIERYRQIAAASPFSWAVTLTLSDSTAEVDLGQAIGKLSIHLSETWISSRKPSSREQTLSAAIGKLCAHNIGRMSGEVNLDKINLQTSITWPQSDAENRQTPLVQASLRFERLLVKAAFDYQAFIVGDVEVFEFLMFNIRSNDDGDRLFAHLVGNRASAFITALSVSQAVALIQAFERLIQDNRTAYQQALVEADKVMHRRDSSTPGLQDYANKNEDNKANKAPISLRTTIVVALKAVSFGAFPSNFYDSQVLLMEHLNAEARFAVAFEEGKIHSGLGMTLGQLHISLSPVSHRKRPDNIDQLIISEVVNRATSSRSGTILRVPRVVAQMHSWQVPASYQIDYTFKSVFEGKVDVGWNYSRISFIRNMWNNHTKALSSRLGRPVRESAVQIRGLDSSVDQEGEDPEEKREVIKAVVNVPQSKYNYTAINTPVIEAPQLRDMGEATPPLEWIGLQRERLPNVTHQIVIVALLEVAKEVEDSYIRILGSS